jgi:hypothetical protein
VTRTAIGDYWINFEERPFAEIQAAVDEEEGDCRAFLARGIGGGYFVRDVVGARA